MQSAEHQADLCGTCSVVRSLYRETQARAERRRWFCKIHNTVVNPEHLEGTDADLCEGQTVKGHPNEQTMKRKQPQQK